MTTTGPTPPPMPDPDRVRVWRDNFWWRLFEGQWIAVETRAGGAQWTAPPADRVPSDLESIGQGALALSNGQPIAVVTDSGTVYLFTSEWGSVGARWLVGSSGASALLSLPVPPLIVVLRPHPIGRASVQLSSEYVRFAILRDKSNPFLVPWVRRTIQAAGLPDPRGRPNPDNVVAALFAQQKREMAFVNDPLHGEMMANVADLLCLDPSGRCMRGGDCDDQIIVLGSAVASAGIPVRLLVRRYAGNAQSHVTLQYQIRDGSWKCVDPSTDTGACSTAPYLDQFTVDIVDQQNPQIEFLGLGSPDDGGTLGEPPELAPDECEAAVAIAMRVHDVLSRSSSRLRQNADAAAGLGSPPDHDACRLIATADLLTDAIEDGCRGARPLSVTPGGDLLVGSRASDTFAVVTAARMRSSGEATYSAELAEPGDSDHSLRACYLVAQNCDRMASAICAQALGEPPGDELGTLGSFFGYPTVSDLASLLDSAAYNVQQLQAAAAACTGWPNDPAGFAKWTADLQATFQAVAAATAAANPVLTQTPSWLTHWRDLVDAGAMGVWDQVRGVIDQTIDLDRRIRANGQCAAPTYPNEPQPSGLDPDMWALQTADSALKGLKSVASNALGPVTLGIGGALVGVALTIGGLYLFSRINIFGGGSRRAVASAPGRRRSSGRRRYRRMGRLSAGRLYAERIRIDRGGYDRSGRYWGTGAPLYRVSDADGELDVYVRAPSAKTAKDRAQSGQGTRADRMV